MSLYPFWFVDSTLLKEFFQAEISAAARLLADQPELPKIFDVPDLTLSQRGLCFQLLAHRKLIEELDEAILARYDTTVSTDLEQRTLERTHSLVPDDAPEWALEMNRVVDQIPLRIVEAMPEPLQTEGHFPDTEERREAVRSAAALLETVEQLQGFVNNVLDQQWKRLERRWSLPVANKPSIVARPSIKKRRGSRTADKLRARRDKMIAEIDDISRTPFEFLQLMDERRIEPQPTWAGWPRSWVKAYRDPHLRKLIQQDKSRALARARTRRSRSR